ncbi:MAG: DNA methyltransferase [Dehalococcoidia bacterium]|nr:DNA methyltransferase [Dehalococcoidia bacterium]
MTHIGEPVQLLYGASPIERKLRARLERDLSFAGHRTAYASHNTHAFAAKFPPQLPRAFIEDLTLPGERVLDPMAGSGTAIVEAALCGRVGIGADLDPLATAISAAKTTAVDCEAVASLTEAVTDYAQILVANGGSRYAETVLSSLDPESADFVRYWFLPDTIAELGALRAAIIRLTSPPYRRLFDVLLSSIIVTKSGGVSMARDLAHSRPHRVDGKRVKSAIQSFAEKAGKLQGMLGEIESWPGTAYVVRSDCRHLPLTDSSIDLVVTSPPYANAIDYVRAHKFSLVWLGYRIGTLSRLRTRYIGAELGSAPGEGIPSTTCNSILANVERVDRRRARIIGRYFRDMRETLGEVYRVLRAGRAAIVVVGSSTVRGICIPTALILAELGESVGLKVVGVKERSIDRDRRLMPVSRVSNKEGIEARMHGEEVVAFVKS